ncbi:MAG TPA: hypothetical protein VM554_15070 [Acidisarcina sp.]|nr:hypothetical protein [Acidisarcina sp.]
MRRFLILICLLFLALPAGINLVGCSTNKNAQFCNGLGYGPKRTAVATINLDPKVTGISLAYGQTAQLATPTAFSCSPAEPVSVSLFEYGSTNLKLVDVSPTGAVCGGTWNRDSPGGITNFTICTPPAGGYTLDPKDPNYVGGGVAYLTASAGGATSNTVAVYVHPPVSSISIPTQTACVSQNHTLPDPLSKGTVVKDQSGNVIDPKFVGNLTFSAVNPSIVSIDTTGVATAQSPGSTAITATLSQTSSAAGYFFTCPPASITLTYADGSTSKTVQQGSPQPLTAVVKDVNNVTLTGVALQYTSTLPTQVAVDSNGVVNSIFPGSAAVTAICQPGACNPSPINEIGVLGNGKPIVSNSVQVTAPGLSSNYLWISSTATQSFVPVDLTTGTVGAPIKLPYFPNSMVLNQSGSSLYFGSYRELMIYSTPLNVLTKEDISVPGVVLAVAPDNSEVVINDQLRQVIYLYNPSTGSYTSFGGVAISAAYTPDSKTVYIAGSQNLYVHSAFTGWSTYDISGNESLSSACMSGNNLNSVYTPPSMPSSPYNPFCGPGLAVTIPSVGAFISGSQTTAHAFCPDNSSNPYYPTAASVAAATDKVGSTNDGQHIIGATANPPQLSDISVTIPTGACPANNGLTIPTTLNQAAIPGISPTAIHQVVTDPNSSMAFITYSTASQTPGGLLPYYQVPSPGTLGPLGSIPLVGNATAPLVGIFSPDNSLFFTGTSGDNLVHYIDTKTLTDIKQIDPKLLDGNGKPVPAEFLAVRPRATT